MPGAHKIGAAISGPRITGGNFMDTTLFLIKRKKDPLKSLEQKSHWYTDGIGLFFQ